MKGISYQYEAVNLLQKDQLSSIYTSEQNMMQQVPVLEFKDTLNGETITMTQSLAIIEFLDEAFPTNKLLPSMDQPLQRSRVRQISEVINSGTQPLQNFSH